MKSKSWGKLDKRFARAGHGKKHFIRKYVQGPFVIWYPVTAREKAVGDRDSTEQGLTAIYVELLIGITALD